MNVHSTKIVTKPRQVGRPATDDKRRRILDAALRAFAARGYHGTTVPEVAKAAHVATGTLYHYFEHKQGLVNELYREAKLRMRGELLDGLATPDIEQEPEIRAWFDEIWRRMSAFAKREPDTFRFLEMQDHVEYLDPESRRIELSTVVPLFNVARRVHDGSPVRADVMMALIWGAFCGVVKASRIGYCRLDDAALAAAGGAVWQMFEPEARRTAKRRPR